MPEITSHQSYELDKQSLPGRSQTITNYINQPTRKSSQTATMSNAYSLHVEHFSLKKKRELALKASGTWRENLNILRTIPRPHEKQLLKGEEHQDAKKKRKSRTGNPSLEKNNVDQQKQKKASTSVKNRSHIVRLSASAYQESESRGKNTQKEPDSESAAVKLAASLGEILDPQVSSGERYDKYIKDIERDKELDKDDLASLYSHSKSELGMKEAIETEDEVRHNVSLETDFEDNDDTREYTFEVIDTSRFNSRNKDLNNYLSERVAEVKISSRAPSKAPSRIGRVSSMGLEGRISVTGTHVSEKMTSRLSMANEMEGKSYVLRDGEIPRKVYIPRDEAITSRGVHRDVKLMQYLTKHSKVTVPAEGVKSETKQKRKSWKKSKVYLQGKGTEETEIAEVKGGGFKIVKSSARKTRTAENGITTVQKSKCEIQTQTDVQG